jgi:hypothetical protein
MISEKASLGQICFVFISIDDKLSNEEMSKWVVK